MRPFIFCADLRTQKHTIRPYSFSALLTSSYVRPPLPAPNLVQTWLTLRPRLHHWARQAKHALNLQELHEWYWDGAGEELSESACATLQNHPSALANFDALCAFDMDCGGDQSAAAHLLSVGELNEMEVRILRGILQARLRVMHVHPRGESGLQKAEDLNSGQVFWVEADSWPTPMAGGQDYLVRLVKFPSIALWVGPCFPIPSDRQAPLRKEAEETLAELMRVPGAGLRGQRESALVDFHHQWTQSTLNEFGNDFGTELAEEIVVCPPFTLLRGA